MINTDPYATTYGRNIDITNTITQLKKWLVVNTFQGLNYEFVTGNEINLYIITGHDQAENEIPIFSYPIYFVDVKNYKSIAVDIRMFVKKLNGQPEDISSNLRDASNGNFFINAGLIMSDFITGNLAPYRKVFPSVVAGYAKVLLSVMSNLVAFTINEILEIEIALHYIGHVLLTPNKDNIQDYKDAIISKISTSKLTMPVKRVEVEHVVAAIDIDDRFDKPITLEVVLQVVNSLLPEAKQTILNIKILVGLLSNLWYGINSTDIPIISTECMPVFIAMMSSALLDRNYKRTRLTAILEKYARAIDMNGFTQYMGTLLKEKRVTY